MYCVGNLQKEEVRHMASISISDLYRGEGPGEKYGGILNAVFHEVFTKGIPEGCSEQTWIELLTVKHTFLVAERMKKEGDVVSELSEAASPVCISEKETAFCSGAHCAPPALNETRREVKE
jgi:hypothetical protein